MVPHAFFGAIVLAIATSPAAAAHPPVDSWGRAGVDFDTYRKDALECGLIGYYADVSQTDQAKAFVLASRRLEAAEDSSPGPANASPEQDMYRTAGIAARSEQIRQSIRPEKKMKELRQAMVGVVEACLRQRGYISFRLTEEQRKALGELKKGSPERKQFLYRLASDPEVLETQALVRKSA